MEELNMSFKYATAVADHLLDGNIAQAAGIAETANLFFKSTKPDTKSLSFNWVAGNFHTAYHVEPTDYLQGSIYAEHICRLAKAQFGCGDCGCSPAQCIARQEVDHYTVSIAKHGVHQYKGSTEWGIGWYSLLDDAGPFKTLDEAKEFAERILRQEYDKM